MSDQNVQELLEKLLKGDITSAEQEALAAWINTPENTDRAEPLLEAAWQQFEPSGKMDETKSEAILSGILNIPGREATVIKRSFLRKYWWAAAAAVVIAGSTWLMLQRPEENTPVVTVPETVQPGRNGAVLTLADGRNVVLDSLHNGHIAEQNGTAVSLTDGQLTYAQGKTDEETVSYNTMSTPRGRQFQLVLPDGTHVWLNAASSIRYPTAFRGNERTVEITGEAYFQVASQSDPAANSQPGKGKKPFYVISRNQQIEVTGTQFNVNAYEDEAVVATTLFEGKVMVTPAYNKNDKNFTPVALVPGEQLRVSNHFDYDKFKLGTAELSQASAWINGFFNFENTSLDAVLRQLSRWYDIDVVYEGTLPKREFGGEMERALSFQQILNILKAIGVNFKLEGNKKLIIL